MMTHDEMIAVIQHHKNGGVLQFKPKPQTEWYSCAEPNFDFSRFDYRAKPEPMVIHAAVKGDSIYSIAYSSKEEAMRDIGFSNGKLTYKKFIEVTE
jgi:hypothetical protein